MRLATIASTSNYPVLFAQDGDGSITQVLEDNFGEDGFSITDLDRITVPPGGQSTYFAIPDEAPAAEITGVMVHKQTTRGFWFKKRGADGEEDGPPDCASDDGKVGFGVFGPGSEANPDGACASCPMNVYGSAPESNGKACKEQMQVFMLLEDAVLPTQVSFPPTSLRGFSKYMTRLASKGKSFHSVVTSLKLKIEKGGGQTYAVIEPSKVGDLDPEEARAARGYGATIRAHFESSQRARKEAREAAQAAEGQATTPVA